MPPKKNKAPAAASTALTENAINPTVAKYQKMDHREHVLARPGMYIGSIDEDTYNTWVADLSVTDTPRVIKRDIKAVPGLYKIFDEILVNAVDHATRLKQSANKSEKSSVMSNASTVSSSTTKAKTTKATATTTKATKATKAVNASDAADPDLDKKIHHVKQIKIDIDRETGRITVWNNGEGIDVSLHPTENIYYPELIFGHMLTSSNYDDTEEKIVGGTNGLGSKCLALDTKIPLFTGDFKLAKDVKIGDVLIGDDGTPRTVVNMTTGHGKMYEITQTQGEPYKVNDEHIMTLHMPDHKVIFWNANGWSMLWWDTVNKRIKTKHIAAIKAPTECEECGFVLHSRLKRHYTRCHPDKVVPSQPRKSPTSTPDMNHPDIKRVFDEMQEFARTIDDDNTFDISIKDYLNLSWTTQRRLAGVRGDCVDWEHKDVELDPYVLGLWLGDGVHAGYSYVCDGDNDHQIMDYLKEWGKDNDAQFKKTGKYTYGISSVDNFHKKGHAPLKKLLNRYNLVKNKHVPYEYIVNSRDVRLKVLAGFIDTDGSVFRDGTGISISQGMYHERLIRDMLHLARSLGFYCTLVKYNATFTYKGEKKTTECFKLNISGDIDDIPTRLPRKKCRTTKSRNVDKSTGYIRVKDIGNGDYVGFEINGNQRFLINDFTVTHNCTNIFSKEFNVETVDAVHKKLYTQTFKNNMSVVEKPVIKSASKLPYTQISFLPDYERFKSSKPDGTPGLSDDMYALMLKRCYDVCAVTDNDVTVTVNGKKLEYKSFERYADLYLGPKADHPRFYEQINDRWEVIATAIPASAPMGFDQVSFVNGIWTLRGGKHVDYIQNQIVNKLCELANKNKKCKGVELKPQHVRNFLLLFVKSTITNPTFDSQTKDMLTSPVSKFGSKGEISDKLIEKLLKSDIVERAVQLCTMNDTKLATKTDGKKKNILRGIDKLDDANWAGTARSHECTLILTEGDSAKSMAIAGMAVTGRDKWGCFPLKGKLLNVQDIALKKLSENEEITNLKKILGLETGKVYKDVKDLRYGRIMLLTDSDADGSHIKGLLFNLFYSQWPSLFEVPGFLTSMLTPVMKARKGNQVLSFYNVSEFKQWEEQLNETGWQTKYYKGLGTSTATEAREYFKEMKDVTYMYTDEGKEAIDLAFNKKRADDRKQWLGGYNRDNILDYAQKQVSYVDFVHKDLIHFSNYDIERSIPNICDGLKTSQRKILYCCFKRNITSAKEMKVAQLSGAVAEVSAYHHGEVSLQGAIINMAQDYVGSNNINLLIPAGMFGTRRMGGKDSASPRYIHTHLTDIALKLYRKEDQQVLTYLEDDGLPVEPEWYIPILPMVLINGAMGIGTGFSTLVPSFNPMELRDYLKRKLQGATDDELRTTQIHPWCRGFKGRIVNNGNGKYTSYGLLTRASPTTVQVTELPIGFWTEDFKIHLEKLVDARPDIKNYESYYTDTTIDFHIQFQSKAALDDALKDNKLEADLGLASSKQLSTTNMYLFNRQCQITKYNTVHDIIDEYYHVRLDMYAKRKASQLADLQSQLLFLNAKVAFIMLIVNKVLKITEMTKQQIVNELSRREFPKQDDNTYDYLLRLPVYNLTTDKVKELEDDVNKVKSLVTELETTTITDMWLQELDQLDLAPYMSEVKVESADADDASAAGPSSGKKPRQSKAKTPAKPKQSKAKTASKK